ncbi:MAG: questin oxidase family protein [Candidatus Nanopelagicales bacterium]|jgi:hypothetical protein
MNRLLATGTYDEALERLHRTGPELDGWMSNHGPMAVEALARRGAEGVVHRWTDDYSRRLEQMPEARIRIDADHWAGALGDPSRLGDWIAYFRREVRERTWTDVLAEWWPRLLPGIAAGATHGVIRTGHAVHALRFEATDVRVDELAHALGYWAGRWQAVPAVHLSGRATATSLVAGVPRVADQSGGIRDRLAQLGGTAGWHDHVAALAQPSVDDVPLALDDLVDAVVVAYPRVAHGNPTMLVHACTAPNAVARVLPSLPRTQWRSSYAFAWSASAAVLAAYLPDGARPTHRADIVEVDADEAWHLAVAHAGEHVVKLGDTALDVHARTGDPAALEAVLTAVRLDA